MKDQEWESALVSLERAERMLSDPEKLPQFSLHDYAIFRLGTSYKWIEQAALALERPQLAIEKNRKAVQSSS